MSDRSSPQRRRPSRRAPEPRPEPLVVDAGGAALTLIRRGWVVADRDAPAADVTPVERAA